MMSVFFFKQYYNICQHLIKKRLTKFQKMASKLCNVSKVHDSNKREFKIPTRTKKRIVYTVLWFNQLICITNGDYYYTTKLFAWIIICEVHNKNWHTQRCANFNTSIRYAIQSKLSKGCSCSCFQVNGFKTF